MMQNYRQDIVVGVSGSAASQAALCWAAQEARLRDATLHVVRSWEARPAAPYAPVGALPAGAEVQASARTGLAAAMRAAFGPVAPADVTSELTQGVPERVLADRSTHADLLVLGITSPGWQSGRSAGPVVRACLARVRCPVVVISGAGGGPDVRRADARGSRAHIRPAAPGPWSRGMASPSQPGGPPAGVKPGRA